MALTFPLPIPIEKIRSIDFNLAEYMAVNMLGGGQTQVRSLAQRRWRAVMTTPPVSEADAQKWEAWRDAQRGGLHNALLYNPARAYPVAYRQAAIDAGGFVPMVKAGGGAFTGAAVVSGLATYAIGLSGLPIGFLMGAGDLVGLIGADGKYALHRIVEDAIGDGSGVATVAVEAEVLTSLFNIGSPGVTATFVKPSCLMTFETGTWSANRDAGGPQPISFSMIQALY